MRAELSYGPRSIERDWKRSPPILKKRRKRSRYRAAPEVSTVDKRRAVAFDANNSFVMPFGGALTAAYVRSAVTRANCARRNATRPFCLFCEMHIIMPWLANERVDDGLMREPDRIRIVSNSLIDLANYFSDLNKGEHRPRGTLVTDLRELDGRRMNE